MVPRLLIRMKYLHLEKQLLEMPNLRLPTHHQEVQNTVSPAATGKANLGGLAHPVAPDPSTQP